MSEELTMRLCALSEQKPSRKGSALVSVVVPCFNEQDVLRDTNLRLTATLEHVPLKFEIIYVDDGSLDLTPDILRELATQDEHIRVVRFSRNFGHQMAI